MMINKKKIKDLKEVLRLIAEYEVISEAELNKMAYRSGLDGWFQGLTNVDKKIIEIYQAITSEVRDKFCEDKGKVVLVKGASPLSRFWDIGDRLN